MENNFSDKYLEGIWYIDKDEANMAFKFSNGNLIKVPSSKEILEEIKRQLEAKQVFKKFQELDVQDDKYIGYLNVILRDYVNFLDQNDLNILINKMRQLKELNTVDTQNIFYINQLENYLSLNDVENFEDLLEQFNSYNQEYFMSAFVEKETVNRHM